MMKIRFIALALFALIVQPAHVLACGGVDADDAQIISLPYVQKVHAKITSVYGTAFEIESVVHSENRLLDLDKQAVAAARCAAQFINVYFVSQPASGLVCMTTFQLTSRGQLDFSGSISAAACRRSKDQQPELVEVEAN